MTRKGDLYALVAEFRGHHWSPAAIAKQLKVTERRVQQVISDTRAPATPWPELPALLRERADDYTHRSDGKRNDS